MVNFVFRLRNLTVVVVFSQIVTEIMRWSCSETVTYQIIDLRTTLRYLGVPILGKTYLFGDNSSVITNSTMPHSQLNKRHIALSYHRVREAVACKDLLGFYHIPGTLNPADILSKHWGFADVWTQLKPLLFWSGETMEIKDNISSKDANSHLQGEY